MCACSKRTGGESGMVSAVSWKASAPCRLPCPRVADGAIHGAGELQLGRELRAHVARQFHDGRHGKAIPVQRRRPSAAARDNRWRGNARPAAASRCPRRWSAVRAAGRSGRGGPRISSGQPWLLPGIRSQRCTSSMSRRPVMPMLSSGPARCSRELSVPCTPASWPRSSAVTSPRAARSTSRSRSTRSGVGVPAALEGERSEALRGAVGARRLGRTVDLPTAAGAGRARCPGRSR